MTFIERLQSEIVKKRSHVVVGLDPVVESMPKPFVEKFFRDTSDHSKAVAELIWSFNRQLIDGLRDIAVAFKPQIAFYEAHGLAGMRSYARTLKKLRDDGLLSIGDVKRGDIGSTAAAYAKAHLSGFGSAQGDFESDAITVNPLFGTDGVKPFLKYVEENGKGLFVLLKTSNPSSAQFQDLAIACDSGKRDLFYQKVGFAIAEWGKNFKKGKYSNVGAVIGATYPQQLAELRRVLPWTPFLIPGFGAQGGTADDVSSGFDEEGFGAIINSSRGIIYAGQDAEDFVAHARESAEKMRREIEAAISRTIRV